jgi:two-component system response regulator YesN
VDNKRKRFEQQLFQDMLQQNMPVLREAMLRQLLTGIAPEEQDRLIFYNIALKEGPISVVVLQPSQVGAEGEYERNLKHYRFALAVQEILAHDPGYLFFSLETEERHCLLACGLSDRQPLSDLLQRLQQNVALMCRESVSIGVGKTVFAVRDIPQSYQTALLALEHCTMEGGSDIMFFGDLLPEQTSFPPVRLDDMKARLSESVAAGQTARVQQTLEQLLQELRVHPLSVQVLHTACIDLTNAVIWKVSTYYPTVIPSLFGGEVSFLPLMGLTEPADMVQWISTVLLPISENITERQLSRQGQLAAELKNYMDSNLEKDMTVESIASVASLSRGYASSIFKQQ